MEEYFDRHHWPAKITTMNKPFDRRKHGSPHGFGHSGGQHRPPSPKVGTKKFGGSSEPDVRTKAKTSGSNRKSPTSHIYDSERWVLVSALSLSASIIAPFESILLLTNTVPKKTNHVITTYLISNLHQQDEDISSE